jgi:hypothetical protein
MDYTTPGMIAQTQVEGMRKEFIKLFTPFKGENVVSETVEAYPSLNIKLIWWDFLTWEDRDELLS